MDAIGERLGVAEDLKKCFPKTYQQILSIAYYLILEDKSPLYRFEKWSSLHKHPYGKNITSQLARKKTAITKRTINPNLPFCYRKLAGNIPDSKTIKGLLAELDVSFIYQTTPRAYL